MAYSEYQYEYRISIPRTIPLRWLLGQVAALPLTLPSLQPAADADSHGLARRHRGMLGGPGSYDEADRRGQANVRNHCLAWEAGGRWIPPEEQDACRGPVKSWSSDELGKGWEGDDSRGRSNHWCKAG